MRVIHTLRMLIMALPLLCILAGCSSSELSVSYLNNAGQVIGQGAQPLPAYALSIKPADELRINISSLVPEATAMYNLTPFTSTPAGNATVQSELRLSTYVVNPDGYITLPGLGDVKAMGLTTQQLKEVILQRVAQHVKDPVVSVELVSMEVDVLGQVASPGRRAFRTQRVTVLDVIAESGGILLNGRKDNVRLLREQDGHVVTHMLDLSDANLIYSDCYFVQQNDVLIVEPNDIARRNATYDQMNGFKLSVISTVVSACSVIASLLIALSK